MASALESPMMLRMAEPLVEYARHLEPLFPHLEWNLKRSGYTIDSPQYLSVTLYMTTVICTMISLVTVVPILAVQGLEKAYTNILFSIVVTIVSMIYYLLLPSAKMSRRSVLIDTDLEYMLKDMQIQLSAGVPLFDTFVNIARGEYGECSRICEGIIQEVEQGKSMTDVLDDVGMWSPSEYFRKTLWQIVNALKSGSDVAGALDIIANDIRMEKENKIKSYGKELNLYGLIYLMLAVIIPSMGVTLLVILSSFLGGGMITKNVFYMILVALAVFQLMFILFVRSKRPTI
jgi:archaeal flagellar protein FlaJ